MKHVRDMNPAEINSMCARVYLAEARRRQASNPSMALMLLEWARNAANRARAWKPEPPVQGRLFP